MDAENAKRGKFVGGMAGAMVIAEMGDGGVGATENTDEHRECRGSVAGVSVLGWGAVGGGVVVFFWVLVGERDRDFESDD
jgi:hypothetical protein